MWRHRPRQPRHPRHPRRRESSFALLRYDIIDACARARCDAGRREAAGARTKGQSSFSRSCLAYYPCLAVRLTRHAYKAVFIAAVTGQRVASVRDLSRRREVEREYSSRSQNINRSEVSRALQRERETSRLYLRRVIWDHRWKILRQSERGLSDGSCRDIMTLLFVTPLSPSCRSKSWFLTKSLIALRNALLRKKNLGSKIYKCLLQLMQLIFFSYL